MPTKPDHYFSERPHAASAPRNVTLHLPEGDFPFSTDTGVFSYRTIDPGTRILLKAAPPPPTRGDVLDLGCGYGPIAVVWGKREPNRQIWAVDINERALALTRENAAAAGLTNIKVARPDEVPTQLRFAAIYSNPPIKTGKAQLRNMLTHWLARLLAEGAAYLVVSRHLGSDSLAQWLASVGYEVARLSSRQGYRVLQVTLPPSGG